MTDIDKKYFAYRDGVQLGPDGWKVGEAMAYNLSVAHGHHISQLISPSDTIYYNWDTVQRVFVGHYKRRLK